MVSMENKKTNYRCATCGNEVFLRKYQKERNDKYYCNRECYNNRRKDNLKRLKRGTQYYNNLLENSTCACGVSEKYLLQIHHIDGNHNNNIPENLEVVCANCHVKRHLRKNKKGELVYHSQSLTKVEPKVVL